MKQSATFTPCGQFRQQLLRVWDDTKPVLPFCLLNPSVAGKKLPDGTEKEDPTSRKCIGFAQRLGYGGMVICNLYDYCATKPPELKRALYPRSPGADDWILQACAMGDGTVICGWGANARGLAMPGVVTWLLRAKGFKLKALRLLADGIPEHPLMLPYSCVPFDLLPPLPRL